MPERRPPGRNKNRDAAGGFDKDDIAAMMAGQTALVMALVGLLIDKKIVRLEEVEHCLRDLLIDCEGQEGAHPRTAAPIRHALNILAGANKKKPAAGGSRRRAR